MSASLRITLTDSAFALRMVPGADVATSTATCRPATISVRRHRRSVQPAAVCCLRRSSRRQPKLIAVAKSGWSNTRNIAEVNTR